MGGHGASVESSNLVLPAKAAAKGADGYVLESLVDPTALVL